ncbi:MAG: cytochrome C [Hydrogenophilales bacterium CG17_big_fil_post_rev_8_21_14_2_50_63_12]|nr:MAG: cytochrome C [Hydrogenophilales bacterium CG17_big_fil_post_rev_8_21_14_2_50_63_12]PIX98293.1 MAG: cytochrome C [Hydrogenophilales bacterium CG_4_10_14_3_um_filter_63_21]PJB02546.1 MAG: cytochrome C [Hydrogenophilales bacterium CG_4_9_14_3_um_filter_63_34]
MKLKPTLIAVVLSALAAHPASAEFQRQPRVSGIETYGYKWNPSDQDMNKALAYKANAKKGRATYKICKGCHQADGSGLADASYPQLAGQHASVIIKQMMDIRAGRRDNPRMYPFSGEWIVSAEEIADIAAYLNQLPPPAGNGKGDGANLALGKHLYDQDCASCHGKNGEGDAKKFYPMVAHQHFAYLKRETRESRDQGRRNTNPDMVKVLKNYSDADVAAVSDYLSRLTLPKK